MNQNKEQPVRVRFAPSPTGRTHLGSGRTALFGNLIPIFASIEAVIFLAEKITPIHFISFILVVCGLVIANLKK